ncbi:hypothetical protein [Meiothermus ruber]|jgi:hypothetical protein|uniref:Uncharacterized protein n=1 Tax=Meiothermus ruber (strain ATCC 35948 / DSM 1279 / VKM B-1258 / 21) TaxID=504728 RepID=D3PP85_MEIRD|nr:hypothetical protein [Meiothermus ruber]GIW31241.1 MAG: hypothetical protein KatS3mg071_1415 [Meiothermus sp.]ADD27494.1 hypothetical protein Mrub_0728 [Meiothermus ruber DSM 1279]AGK03958.1 hypothetical protein K649_03280 [Meiothermus ruber DSM 1279]MCL6530650.1 hypothetical protein [Meiothermus ruber]MCX7802335.1 hypothetical protein [Meiothermus ruber]
MSTVRWSALEAALPLNELPAFHRAFLKLHRPELAVETLPLRRVQQYVSQTLHLLAQAGKARAVEGDFELEADCIPPPYRP